MGVMVGAQSKRNFQIASNTPVILAVEAQAVNGYGLRQSGGKVLLIACPAPIKEIEQRFASAESNRSYSWGVISYIITVECDAEPQGMIPSHLGEIVHDSVLRNISSLRPDIQLISQGEESAPGKCKPEGNKLRCCSQVLWRKDRAVPRCREVEL